MDFNDMCDRIATLSPRLRETLELLLTGIAEREAAEKLAISSNTMHDYVRQVYRAFGVRTRPGLMALFVDARIRRVFPSVAPAVATTVHVNKFAPNTDDGQGTRPFARLAAAAI